MSRQFFITLSEALGACPKRLVSKYSRNGSFHRERFHHTADVRTGVHHAKVPKKRSEQYVINPAVTDMQPRRMRKRRAPHGAHTNDSPGKVYSDFANSSRLTNRFSVVTASKPSIAVPVPPLPIHLRNRKRNPALYTRTLHTFVTEEAAQSLKQSSHDSISVTPLTPTKPEKHEIQPTANDLPLPKDHSRPTLAAEVAAAVGVIMYYIGAIWFQSEFIAAKYLENDPNQGSAGGYPNRNSDMLTEAEMVRCRATFDVLARAMDKYHTEEKLLAFYRFLRRKNFPFLEEDLLHVLRASWRVMDWTKAINIYEGLKRNGKKDLADWAIGAVTEAYLRTGDIRSALSLLNAEEANGRPLPLQAYQNLIWHYTKKREPRAAMHMLERLVTNGLHPNGAIIGMMVTLVSKDELASQRLKEIIAAYSPELQEDPSLFYYLVRTAAEQRQFEVARNYLRSMRDVVSDKEYVLRTYNSLIAAHLLSDLNAKANAGAVAELLEELERIDMKPDSQTTELLKKSERGAMKLYLETYKFRLYGAVRSGDASGFRECWEEIKKAGLKPDEAAFNARIRASVMHDDVGSMERAFDEMKEAEVVPNPRIVTSLIAGYSSNQETDKAVQTIEKAFRAGIVPDVVMFNALMYGFALSGNMESLQTWWARMVDSGLKPDVFSYTILLQGLFVSRDPELPRIHQRIFTSEVRPDAHAFTLLYVDRLRSGDKEAAQGVLDDMMARGIMPTVATSTALIRSSLQRGDVAKAFETVRMLVGGGKKMDAKVYETIMRHLLNEEQYEKILVLYNSMEAEFVHASREVYHMILTSLMKLRRIDDVEKTLRRMVRGGVPVTWQTMHILIIEVDSLGFANRQDVVDRIWNIFVDELGWHITPHALNQIVSNRCRHNEFDGIMKTIRDGMRSGVQPAGDVKSDVLNLFRGLGKVDDLKQVMGMWAGDVDDRFAEFYGSLVQDLVEEGDSSKIIEAWEAVALKMEEGQNSRPANRDSDVQLRWMLMLSKTVDGLLELYKRAAEKGLKKVAPVHSLRDLLHLLSSNSFQRCPPPPQPNIYFGIVRKLLAAGKKRLAEEMSTNFVLQALRSRERAGNGSKWVGLDENGAAVVVGMCIKHAKKWGAGEGFGDRILAYWKRKRQGVANRAEALLMEPAQAKKQK